MVGQKSGRTCHVQFLVVNVLQLCLDVLFFITSCCVDFGVFVCNVSWPGVLLKSALVVFLATWGAQNALALPIYTGRALQVGLLHACCCVAAL